VSVSGKKRKTFHFSFKKVQSTTNPPRKPLLLLSLDVRKWVKEAGKAILCMGLAAVSILFVSSTEFLVVKDSISNAWHLAGMAIGLYTGGTPNLAAIKTALDIDGVVQSRKPP